LTHSFGGGKLPFMNNKPMIEQIADAYDVIMRGCPKLTKRLKKCRSLSDKVLAVLVAKDKMGTAIDEGSIMGDSPDAWVFWAHTLLNVVAVAQDKDGAHDSPHDSAIYEDYPLYNKIRAVLVHEGFLREIKSDPSMPDEDKPFPYRITLKGLALHTILADILDGEKPEGQRSRPVKSKETVEKMYKLLAVLD